MSIKQDIEELNAINAELKRMNVAIGKLRSTKKIVEDRISTYLQEENLPAITDKSKGFVVMLNKHQRRVSDKPKKARDLESIDLLKNMGVENADDVYKTLRNVGYTSVEKRTLKISKI